MAAEAKRLKNNWTTFPRKGTTRFIGRHFLEQ